MTGCDDTVRNLTATTFDEIITQSVPVVIDFWSEFCSPCHAVSQSLAELAREMSGHILIGKVDVVEQPELAARFNVSTLPTILVFKGGRPVARLCGPRPKTHIVRAIAPHFG